MVFSISLPFAFQNEASLVQKWLKFHAVISRFQLQRFSLCSTDISQKNGQDVDNNLITSGKKGVFYQASVYLFIYLLVLSNFT